MSHELQSQHRGCNVDGCSRKHQARGFCHMHYRRLLRTGNPLGAPKLSTEERFWAKVTRTESCWNWSSRPGKHALFLVDGSLVPVHRYAYELMVGPIPDGLEIDHLCRNQICVNPEHLEPVTREENLRRGWGHRLQNGMTNECIHGHKYTPENTYVNPRGHASCRRCSNESKRKSLKRLREKRLS